MKKSNRLNQVIVIILALVMSLTVFTFVGCDMLTSCQGNPNNQGTPNSTSPIELPKTMTFTQAMSETDEGILIKATVEPEEAINKNIVWEITWNTGTGDDEYDAWRVNKDVSEYVSINVEENFNVRIKCLQAFGCPILLTATSENNTDVSAKCDLEYSAKVTGVNLSGFSDDFSSDKQLSISIGVARYILNYRTKDGSWNCLLESCLYGIGTIKDNDVQVTISVSADLKEKLIEQGLTSMANKTVDLSVESFDFLGGTKTYENFYGITYLDSDWIKLAQAIQALPDHMAGDNICAHLFDLSITTQVGSETNVTTIAIVSLKTALEQMLTVQSITLSQSTLIF